MKPPEERGPVTTLATVTPRSLVVVKASINGNEPASFLVDTFSEVVIVFESWARKWNLADGKFKPQDPRVRDLDSASAGARIRLSSVDVRGARVEKVDCLVVNDTAQRLFSLRMGEPKPGEVVPDLAGLLGFSYLKHFKTTIDFANLEVTLEKNKDEAPPAVNEDEIPLPEHGVSFYVGGSGGRTRRIIVKTSVNGFEPGNFILNTTSLTTTIIPSYASIWKVKPFPPDELKTRGFKPTDKNLPGPVKTLRIGDRTMHDTEVLLAEEGIVIGSEIAGYVGMDFLRNYRLTIDCARNRLILDDPRVPR
ncbi:MAG: pepsin/retropepsin-like aspartic protease family protein [Planctomycetota bacterium]|nr:pepsin/retropepsin-like aspartic protease family protein [Planctomycetota bacterium]